MEYLKPAAALIAPLLLLATPVANAEPEAENIIDLPWKTFRGLQYAHVRKKSSAWAERDLKAFKNAIIKDGAIDTVEQGLLDQLLADSFTLTIRSQPAPDRPPVTITADSHLADDARSFLLSISAEDLQHAIAAKPGESQTSFLMRRGIEGRQELLELVVSSPEARLEFSHLLADRLNHASAEAESMSDYSGIRVSSVLNSYRMEMYDLNQSDRETYRYALRDAVVIAWNARKPGIILTHGKGLFDDNENYVDEAFEVVDQLGLRKEAEE